MMSVSKRTRPELLSPAGDRDSLEAALKNGADAVYLGVREFNARVLARNFSLDDLRKAVEDSHRQGVRVYLAMNTLVKNSEIAGYFETVARAYTAGIDGVIVQHLSFLEIIKGSFPGLPVFMSTQAAVGNSRTASLVKRADRIIPPRELTLEEIKRIVDSGVKVEVFVHGALCFSFSGMCLFSSFVGNRSGNRGCCAQLCRKKYNESYCLSTRELNLVKRIPELIEAGISGFKIEGRMRSPLYVAVATRLYRKAIDSYLAGRFEVPAKELAEIEVVFSREFTEGFMFGERNLISPERAANRGAFLGTVEDGRVLLHRPVRAGDGVGIWGKKAVTGAIIHEIEVEDRPVSEAAAGERARLGIDAPEGARVFLTSSPAISLEPDFVPERAPIPPYQRRRVAVSLPEVAPRKAGGARVMVKAYSLEEATASARAGAAAVFYNIFAPDFPEAAAWPENAILGAYLPRIMSDSEIGRAVDLVRQNQPGAVLAGNLGFLVHRGEFTIPVYLDYSVNAFNDLDLAYFRKYRATPVLSPELALAEMTAFRSRDAIVLCHGDIVLVNTRVPIDPTELVDEKGYRFPVRREGSYWQVLNGQPLGMFNDVRKLMEAGYGQFLIDRAGEGARLAETYREILEHEVPDRRLRRGHTSGHLYRPVQ